MPVCIKCKTKRKSLEFFSFPSDEKLKKNWLEFLHIDGLRLRKESKLCSKHFTEDCIMTNAGKRVLKDGSIPSIDVAISVELKQKKSSASRKKCILCGNNSSDLSYFSVPKDPEMKQKWEKFCEFDLGDGSYSLCHLHFKPSVVKVENTKRKLLPNAIPSIYFDDYQFEFIPVDRKTSNEDNSNEAECMIIEPTVINTGDMNLTANQNSGEESVISVDYSEFNTPPRTPISNNSISMKNSLGNSATNDIVNIFIPSYEHPAESHDNDSTNNRTEPVTEQTTTIKSVAIFTSNGRKKRLCYPGDLKNEDITSIEVAKLCIDNFRQILTKKTRTISTLNKKARRLTIKNAALKETIRQLRAEKAAKEAKEKDELFDVKGWWDS